MKQNINIQLTEAEANVVYFALCQSFNHYKELRDVERSEAGIRLFQSKMDILVDIQARIYLAQEANKVTEE